MVFELKLKSCLLNLLGSAILAFGIYNIHSISGVTEGGVLGLTLLLEHWFSVSPAISGLILNAACYIFGARHLGRDFIGYSIFAGGGFSLFYAIFEMFPRVYPRIADYPLAAALIGAVFIGVGAGIAVRAGGAPSGDDALAMSLSRLMKCDIKWIYHASDALVLALSLTYIPVLTIFYSLITVILSGLIISLILRVGKNEKRVERDVLVGTLRNAKQLDACLQHKFYHIPAKRLDSRKLPIRYVALYQSRSVFGEDAGVRYYGEAGSCRLVPRRKITEIPSDSNELYYCFGIKEWKTLPQPIRPVEGGFVNIRTTLFLLENSRDTFELSLRSENELRIFRSILDGTGGEAKTISSGELTVSSDPKEIRVSRGGRSVFFCSAEDFAANPSLMFGYIQRELDIKK